MWVRKVWGSCGDWESRRWRRCYICRVARRVCWQMPRGRRWLPGCRSPGHRRGVRRRLVERFCWSCRRRVLGIVVGELVPDGADDGTDPVGEGALTLSFWRGVRVEGGGCGWSSRGLSTEDISHWWDGGPGASVWGNSWNSLPRTAGWGVGWVVIQWSGYMTLTREIRVQFPARDPWFDSL